MLRESFSIVRLTKLPDGERVNEVAFSEESSDSGFGTPRSSAPVSIVVPGSGFMGRGGGGLDGCWDIELERKKLDGGHKLGTAL